MLLQTWYTTIMPMVSDMLARGMGVLIYLPDCASSMFSRPLMLFRRGEWDKEVCRL